MSRWSKARFKLENEYLAQSLRGRIQYFVTSYSKSPDHVGRAAVLLDGVEIQKSNYYEAFQKEYEAGQKIKLDFPDLSATPKEKASASGQLEGGGFEAYASSQILQKREQYALQRQMTLNQGAFDQRDFYIAFQEFDNQSIEASLNSQNPIVRMFALLDRRVGKRRLLAVKETVENGAEWIKEIYRIRLEAEHLLDRENAKGFAANNNSIA